MRNALATIVVLTTITSSASAIWVAVPLEILVDEADLIVAGTVTNVKGGFMVGARKYDVAVVKVAKTLKALPGAGKVQEVSIAQPARGGLAVSTDIQFQKGQSGIWLLAKDPDRDVYWAKHPSQFQAADKQKELLDLISARAKVVGGKPVNGLQARAELLSHKRPAGPTSYEVRVSLKNVSDKPLIVCDYVGNRPLELDWTGPDGKKQKSSHYTWLMTADIAALMKANFVTIPAGGVRYVGPRSKDYGLAFQAAGGPPSRDINAMEPGMHRLTIGFVSNENGERFGLKGAWTGKVTANEVVINVK